MRRICKNRFIRTGGCDYFNCFSANFTTCSTGNAKLIQAIKGIGKMTAQRIIVDLRDKIVALGIADEIPVGGAIAAPVNNAVRDEAVAALTMLGFSPAPAQKVVLQILQEQPALPVEQVVKLALKQIK